MARSSPPRNRSRNRFCKAVSCFAVIGAPLLTAVIEEPFVAALQFREGAERIPGVQLLVGEARTDERRHGDGGDVEFPVADVGLRRGGIRIDERNHHVRLQPPGKSGLRNAAVAAARAGLVDALPGHDRLELGRGLGLGRDPLRGTERRDAAHADLARAPWLLFQPGHHVPPSRFRPRRARRIGLRSAAARLVDQHHGVAVGHPEAGVGPLERTPVGNLDASEVKPASARNGADRGVLEKIPQVVLILPVRGHRGDDGHRRPGFAAEDVGREPDAVPHRDHDLLDQDILGQGIFDEVERMVVEVVPLALRRQPGPLEFPRRSRLFGMREITHRLPPEGLRTSSTAPLGSKPSRRAQRDRFVFCEARPEAHSPATALLP